MTESSFPFPADVAGAAEAPEQGTDRRKMALVALAGALLVAVLGYFVVLPAFAGGDGASAPVTSVKKAPAAKAPAKKAAKKPAAKKPAAQPATYNDLGGRKHPFFDLYKEPKAAPVLPGGTTGGTTTGGTVAPATSTGGTTTASGGSSATVAGQRVALMTVYAKDGSSFAQTRVGEVVYTPRVGQVFAGQFKLLAVSGKTATYLYGDEQFTLSVGQEVLK